MRVFRWVANYGFNMKRLTLTWVLFLLIGTLGTQWCNSLGMLAVDYTPITGAIHTQLPTQGTPAYNLMPSHAITALDMSLPAVPCGNPAHVLWYTVDVALPIIDLSQQHRCHIASVPIPPQPDGSIQAITTPEQLKAYQDYYSFYMNQKPYTSPEFTTNYYKASWLSVEEDRQLQEKMKAVTGKAYEQPQLSKFIPKMIMINPYNPLLWVSLRNLYELFGWVMISITLLLISRSVNRGLHDD
jgi:hypothetical protein